MEPDTEIYKSLLQPLLDAKDSKYVLFPKPGVIWAHLERVLSEQHLPHQKPLTPGDPRLEQPNDTLLFVANLSYYPKRAFKAFSSLTTLVLHQLMSAVRSHSLFHKYGTIRMLIWVTDEERLIPLPKHVALRKRSSLEGEISCGKIEEIASSGRPIGVFRRDDRLDAEQTLKVLNNMEKLGISTPEGRETPMQKHLMSERDEEGDMPDRIDNDKQGLQYHKELAEMEAKLAAGEIQKYSDIPKDLPPPTEEPKGRGRRRSTRAAFEFTPEWIYLNRLRFRKATEVNRGNVVLQLTARNDEIMDMQRELYNAKGKPDYESRREELFRLMAEFKDDVAKLPGLQTRVEVLTHIDNLHLLRQDPPGLLFDRREMEPLKVELSDFFPHHELAMLDFQPQAIWPILRENYPANYDVFEYIVTVLFQYPGQSVHIGLKSLWPGAYEWLVAECPTLTNPHKSGDMDLTRLPVRCLSNEMLKEIMEAWMRWPWKPDRIELLGQLTSYESVEEDTMKQDDMQHGLS
jgi:mitochondrial transcription factor 1